MSTQTIERKRREQRRTVRIGGPYGRAQLDLEREVWLVSRSEARREGVEVARIRPRRAPTLVAGPPHRLAGWAFALGLLLVLAAAGSAHLTPGG
ncbi:hypothetical protein [Thermoleophilum album]|uniref:Uncharacterized protein n=1 Tax=Thermoleophilum album TaxID=29539 RepID=A0A1H6FY60_THEAL|nr:hypothetical protein [Thermoleophilum album]SEH15751.1 hypothetical protein SAMN02745716_2051 [Thermoleophilum album]